MISILYLMDNPKKPLQEQMEASIGHYRGKFGNVHTIITAHKTQVDDFKSSEGATVIAGNVQFNHIIITGVEPEMESTDGVS